MTKSIRLLLSFALLACLAAALLPAGALAAFGPVSSFGTEGSGAGQLSGPGKLDVAADGLVYVADEGNNRVDVFSAKGQFAFAFGKSVNPSGAGNPDVCTTQTGCVAPGGSPVAGGMLSPNDVAIAPDGDVDVSDSLHNRIDVFSAQGEFKYAFGLGVNAQATGNPDKCDATTGCRAGVTSPASGSVRQPFGIGTGAVGTSESVYLATANNRIDVFSQQGAFIYAFGKSVNSMFATDVCIPGSCQIGAASSVAGGFVEPTDVDVNAQGEILVLDAGNFRVDSYGDVGAFRSAFGASVRPGGGGTCTKESGCQQGTFGTAAGQIAGGTGLALDPNGSIYIAAQTNRVDDFGADGVFIDAFGAGVVNGQNAFQVCSEESGCQGGLIGPAPGATGAPTGVAIGASGTVYVAEADQSRIERFGEPEPAVPSGTGTKTGSSPAPAPAPGKPAAGTLRLGKLKLNRKKGTATLAVTISGPGAVRVTGKGLRRSQAKARAAGTVKLAIKLGGKAKLALATTGKAKVRAVVAFVPDGAAPLSKRRVLVLRESRRS